MQGTSKEQWMELCEQARNEQDPDRLLNLVRQINRLLEEKENRLRQLRIESGAKIPPMSVVLI